MPRLRSLSLLAVALLTAALGRAADMIASVDYFLPVTYDMVITRSVTKADTETRQKTALTYELFNSSDLLRSILKANGITKLANWTLVARGNTATFNDPRTTDTLSSLEIVARNTVTGAIKSLPAETSIAFSQIYSACTYSRTERQDDSTESPTVVTSNASLGRVAELTQKLAARGNHAAGTLVVTGNVSYTNVYNKVTVGGATTATPVLRPTSATFRAAGSYTDGGADGLAEIRIIFGAPTYAKPATPE